MPQESAQRVAKNTAFLFIRMVVVMLVQLYASRVILRTLGFEDFGIYNVVGSVVVFFSFMNTALNNATSRYLTYDLGAGNQNALNQTYSMAIKSHTLLALLLLLIMEVVGVWFVNTHLNIPEERMPATNWAYQFSLLTFCTHIITVPFNSDIVAHERMNVYAFVSITDAFLKLFIVFALVWSPSDKLISYAILLWVESVLVFLMQVLYCKYRLTDTRFLNKYWDWSKVKQFASYSGWSIAVNAADGATTQCRSIFFNWFLGTIANAALGIANQVITLISVFVGNFSQSYRPQIIKSYAGGDKNYFMKLIFSTSKLSYYMFLIISIPIILNIDYLLQIWLGNYPDHTIGFIKAIIVFAIIDAFQQPLWTAVHATGKLKIHQLMIGFIKILAIPMTYITLRLGYPAELTLYLWAGLNGVAAVARTVYMRVLIGLPLRKYLTDVLIKIVVVSLIVFPASWYIASACGNQLVRLLVSSACSVLLICITTYAIGLNNEERLLCRNLVKKLILKSKFLKKL